MIFTKQIIDILTLVLLFVSLQISTINEQKKENIFNSLITIKMQNLPIIEFTEKYPPPRIYHWYKTKQHRIGQNKSKDYVNERLANNQHAIF